ncbi:glycoside hydrolase, family 18 [Leptospira broomii serovar Hurstbridge str. 5399]|uniref:Glycoside hydrolase, family 18 n=2 Tax=Leptospira broomii TaxID=301541 RepID=T0EWD4_9LEPT|nr:glycoside hydrolase, family 18 [Leptospira broomii serovar Hurstbridge str. 5399]
MTSGLAKNHWKAVGALLFASAIRYIHRAQMKSNEEETTPEGLSRPVPFPPKKTPVWQTAFVSVAWLCLSGVSFYLGLQALKTKSSGSEVSKSVLTSESSQIQLANPSLKSPVGPSAWESVGKWWNSTDFFPTETSHAETQNSDGKPSLPANDDDVSFRASTWFSDYEAMKKTVHLYNEIHPFIYGFKGRETNNGDLYSLWGASQKHARVAELRNLNPRVKIIPTIFRWENKNEKISENIGLNGRNDIRDKHIQNILYEVDTYGFDGIDIDYEGMSCEKKEKFEEFIVLLSNEIHKRGKILSVAVHPKTAAKKSGLKACKGLKEKIKMDFAENWRGPMTHDYAFLAQHADRIKVMAYELHPRKYRNPGPGPQAPNVWIRNIIEYAKERVPSKKLYMAIPTYGYDWALNCNSKIKSVYWSDALKRQQLGVTHQPTNIDQVMAANKNSGTWTNLSKFSWVHEGKTYEDPSIWYKSEGCDRVAFFMNRKAFEEKMTLLRSYDIGGFSFWQLLSDNDPGISTYLELLVTNKLPPVPKVQTKPKNPDVKQSPPEEAQDQEEAKNTQELVKK